MRFILRGNGAVAAVAVWQFRSGNSLPTSDRGGRTIPVQRTVGRLKCRLDLARGTASDADVDRLRCDVSNHSDLYAIFRSSG